MEKKQGIIIIADGLGDRPIKSLDGKTPLEYANTPVLDQLASLGMCGNVYPISPGKPVGTDVGHLHIFGYDSEVTYSGRGPLEAFSGGINLIAGDIAFRGNFGTVNSDNVVIDRRAGRIREGTDILAEAINGMLLSDGTVVIAKALTEHRVAIVFRGMGLSDRIVETDPGTAHEGEKLIRPYAIVSDQAALKTADLLWEFTRKSTEILNKHWLNIERVSKGLLPANVIITRGAGQKMAFDSIFIKNGIKSACIAGDMTVLGIAGIVGMDVFTDETFTGSFDTNLKGKATLAVDLLGKGYDWIVLHIKATDLAGHDNRPDLKVEMIEKIDRMMGDIVKNIDLDRCLISFTSDHSTPCVVRDHSGDGVPTIITGCGSRKDAVRFCGESDFSGGCLNGLTANEIFSIQMDLMGFSNKIGS